MLAVVLLLHAAPAFGQAFSLLHEFSGRRGNPIAGLILGSDGKLYGTLNAGGEAGLGSVYSLTSDGAGGYTYAEVYGVTTADAAITFSGGLLEASDGGLYGGTYFPDGGVIYRVDPDGSFAVVHTLTGNEGGYPSQLIQVPGGDFYGVGSAGNATTAFRMDAAGNLTVLHTFAGPEGIGPQGPLLLTSDGFLYGVCYGGGSSHGTIYRMSLAGSLTMLHAFAGPDGSFPYGGLIEGSDGFLYGGTTRGGAFDRGTVFRIDTDGALTTLHSFSSSEGSSPVGSLLEASDGKFYGTTYDGGASGAGTLFRFDSAGSLSTLHQFTKAEGSGPLGALIEVGGQLVGATYIDGAAGNGSAFTSTLSGNVLVVHAFTGAPGGSLPVGGLVQASDGLLYGTAASGGDLGSGTLFRLDLAGALTRLHSFDGPMDGSDPQVALIIGSDGKLYGAASAGGQSGHGTIFRSTTDGSFEMLHAFSGVDGDLPYASLFQAADGDFYGTTSQGGAGNLGTVFHIDGADVFGTLHDFASGEGQSPSAVIQAPDGDFYGTTVGSPFDSSFVFRMDGAGAVTPIHQFGSAGNSGSALLLASDGNFYGAENDGVFRIDPAGNFSMLHVFQYPDSISYPGELVEGADGTLYGTGLGDGKLYRGAVFRIDHRGDLTVVHRFVDSDGGADPRGRLLQAADGLLYGTTSYGGQLQGGVVYRIDPAAVLAIASVSPASGPAGGGTALTVNGANFQAGATVTIGFLPAPAVVVSGGQQMTVTSPELAAGAAYDLVVTNPDLSQTTLTRGWVADSPDVPPSNLFHDAIGTLFANGITVGCGDGYYCVDAPVSRAQVAVLILKSMFGPGYVPPAASGAIFADVPSDAFAAAWIEDLAARGISAGCGGGNYCPDQPVTRAEMAPLLLKAAIGAGYAPPAPTGEVFGDVPVDGFAAAWIEDLAAREIAAGCSALPALYCPGTPTTRGQMAALLVTAFGLQ